MIWLGYFFLVFIGLIGLFLLVLLFSKTRVAARARLDAQKKNLLVEALFFFRVLKFQFQLEGENKKIFFTLGDRPLFRKNLAGKEQPDSEKKPVKSASKKKPSAWRQIKLLKSGWALLENFLRRFFKSLHSFQISGDLLFGLGSPARTGIFWGVWKAAQNWLPSNTLILQPDFLGKKAEGWIATELHFRLVHLLRAGVPLFFGFRRLRKANAA